MSDHTIIRTGTALDFPGFPVSAASKGAGLIFTAGVLPIDAVSGAVVGTTIGEQARTVLTNLTKILEAAGTSLDRILIVQVYLAEITEDLAGFNEVYTEFFPEEHPPRISVEAKLAWPSLKLELTAIALASPS